MTPRSAADARGAMWCEWLDNWGYDPVDPYQPEPHHTDTVRDMLAKLSGKMPTGRLLVTARRRGSAGEPRVLVEVQETWGAGPDPHGLVRSSVEGCHPHKLSWHAQFEPDHAGRGSGAYRFDLDRRKKGANRIHVHPLGKHNNIRVPAALMDAWDWLSEVERLTIEHWPL